ncbi:TPA: DegT/DnrJ/EryC1/StrS family aminotransferase [Candidatus Dependentiae bacterium]|nr:MAG: DegT/DnrJ/EryC1/StrS aminotransferase [candidate division TM6 bacterium GW2011_GWE2_31_21]KKP53920.1 MAG: DegT/DnrJ/EryC1/StrS aminotransferase [candidate division TM6 bacterium GW2011_GWF2_33_332]HBS47700.1 DegT/DnrJ/EryC1/StrS family aminotransferase [Candidatus Dependentiae bacterium]HBZ73849.1 DegT/DnrJ/EryC1/StrS family aminotransferase [Candidatus Dependentiae bacterium]
MNKLAIFGGKPLRVNLFEAHNTMGIEEQLAVEEVLKSGVLSKFLGCWHSDFYGGPKVQTFERMWAEKLNVSHAISVNSNTSGLITALGAVGIKPGDEVIVSPYTMTASAISPVFWGGVPIFADIDEDNFCLSAKSIEKKITKNTKAILVVHIFGHAADMDEIMELAKKYNLFVIEDAAQAPFGKYKDKYVGTIGHIGVFSLNYHKHIHTGEGGMITTNDSNLAERCQLIRNHGEAVVENKGVKNIDNIFGFNFRMPEMEAAIGIEQLKKFDDLLEKRIQNAKYLNEKLGVFNYLDVCIPKPYVKHCYYQQPMKYFAYKNGWLHRDKYLKVLIKELPSSYMRELDPLIGGGYTRPLYLQPVYQQKAINLYKHKKEDLDYSKGICPVVEKMHYEQLITHEFMRPSMGRQDLDDVVSAFYKVHENMQEIIERQNEI